MEEFNIKDFFNLPRTQKRGLFVLAALLLIIILIPVIYANFFHKNNVSLNIEQEEAIREFIRSMDAESKTDKDKEINFDNVEYDFAKQKITSFPFNPNNLPASEWLKMGFSEHQIKAIKNYELKGGRFFVKEDVKKMYSISDEEYQIIEPFILLPSEKDRITKYTKEKIETPETFEIVELNSADTSKLKTIPGIGSFFAGIIINYRNKLGGYVDKIQLLEIERIDTARFESISQYIDVNPYIIRKININEANFNQLSNHPYITFNMAISLVNYRNRHGNYASVEEIKKSELINDSIFNKISPYLTVQK